MIKAILCISLSMIFGDKNDTTYVVHDPFVDTCDMSFYISPKGYNGRARLDSVLVKHKDREAIYKSDRFDTYDLPNESEAKIFVRELGPEDQYLCNKYIVDAFNYYFQQQRDINYLESGIINMKTIPKKASFKTREKLSAVSDSLTDKEYVKKKLLEYRSKSEAANHRRKVISFLDERFDKADCIYIIELYRENGIKKRARYSIYSPDINVSQTWVFNGDEMRYGSSGMSVYSI